MVILSFFSQNIGFVIAVVAVGGILLGRIWSNMVNWGEITDPQSIIKGNTEYKVTNIYQPRGWTEGWEVGSIICLEFLQRRFFMKKMREIYVSGDRLRFTEEGPVIGSFYQATFTHASSASIIMTYIPKKTIPKPKPKTIVINKSLP